MGVEVGVGPSQQVDPPPLLITTLPQPPFCRIAPVAGCHGPHLFQSGSVHRPGSVMLYPQLHPPPPTAFAHQQLPWHLPAHTGALHIPALTATLYSQLFGAAATHTTHRHQLVHFTISSSPGPHLFHAGWLYSPGCVMLRSQP